MKTRSYQIPLNKRLLGEELQSLNEQIYYLDPSIQSVVIGDMDIKLEVVGEYENFSALAGQITELENKVRDSYRRAKPKTFFSLRGVGQGNADPMPELIAGNQVVRHSAGVFSFQGQIAELILSLDKVFKSFAISLGAVEQLYPPTVLTASMRENGYLNSFPHHALFVSGAFRKFDNILNVSNVGEVSCDVSQSDLEVPTQMLAPTVCYRCFEMLQGTQQKEALQVYTGMGHCNRNEGFINDDLTRLQSFLMREIIFIGNVSEVERVRQEAIEHTRRLTSSWGLEAKLVSASDPFFSIKSLKKRGYQNLHNLKFELKVRLPFCDKWISCMSFNNHQETLVSSYEIQGSDSELVSGCVGYGYERLAYAIYSQHGMNVRKWPPTLRAILFDSTVHS